MVVDVFILRPALLAVSAETYNNISPAVRSSSPKRRRPIRIRVCVRAIGVLRIFYEIRLRRNVNFFFYYDDDATTNRIVREITVVSLFETIPLGGIRARQLRYDLFVG